MKKWKVFSAAVLSAAMLAAPMTAMADDAYRVCFVARASADTFAAWLTNEMKKAADQYDDIELTCVSGEADDAEMAKLNAAVEVDGRDEAAVAKDYLTEKGLLEG